MGIHQLGVVINKLDTVDWAKERFDLIISKLSPFLKQTGFKDVWFIPCSGLTGENLIERKDPNLSSWYSQETLIEKIGKDLVFWDTHFCLFLPYLQFSLDQFQPAPRQIEKPFRFCISDVYKANNFGNAVGGKVESGIVAVGDKLLLMPLREICTVKAIRSHNQQPVDFSVAGDNVDLSLTDLDINSFW